MTRTGIPTAGFHVFSDVSKAVTYCETVDYPVVIKADGLAAGKGVLIVESFDEARTAVQEIMKNKKFGSSGDTIIVDDYLEGEEVSILAFTDGSTLVPLLTSQDHKKIYDGDRGSNTGGMGAYAPAPLVTDALMKRIRNEIMDPVLDAVREMKMDYRGVIYFGLMITEDGPRVLEFNCRFGDPEIQAILPLLETDLLDAMIRVSEGKAKDLSLEWRDGAAVCIVMASKGYPAEYERGKVIEGLDAVGSDEDIIVFHGGTKRVGDRTVTSGGRVLGVTAVGEDFFSAREKAYDAVSRIHFDGAFFRRDIGSRAVTYLESVEKGRER
jgi:phosphoribosylamine--glycine ligase